MTNNQSPIRNKVADSGIVTIDLDLFHRKGERVLFDIKPLLFEELLLREKDFRKFVKEHDWSSYTNKYVAVTCTSDAIIPVWAFMLIASELSPFAGKIVMGDLNDLEEELFFDELSKIVPAEYSEKRVVIKGCGDNPIPPAVYLQITSLLRPFVKSIMYGEPCSTVPVYKKK
jgi:uncharacterized protein DUF2480